MKLKEIMYRKGIKQSFLVKELGVDPARISMHINGIRKLPEKHFEKLAKLIGITIDELTRACGFSENKKEGK